MKEMMQEQAPAEEALGRFVAEVLFGDWSGEASTRTDWITPAEQFHRWQPGTIRRAKIVGKPFPLWWGSPYGRPTEPTLELVQRILVWCETYRTELQKASAALAREALWKTQAQEGWVRALLAHPRSRAALYALARGEKGDPKNRVRDWCLKKKPVQQAKALLMLRLEQRAALRVTLDAQCKYPGRIRRVYLEKLHQQALGMGWDYHRTVGQLFQSKYGDILYGRGGRETVDRERYSKGWHRSHGPASCLNGGARLDSEDNPTCVILENYRGTEVARLPLKKGGS